jgi:hypothetical protein
MTNLVYVRASATMGAVRRIMYSAGVLLMHFRCPQQSLVLSPITTHCKWWCPGRARAFLMLRKKLTLCTAGSMVRVSQTTATPGAPGTGTRTPRSLLPRLPPCWTPTWVMWNCCHPGLKFFFWTRHFLVVSLSAKSAELPPTQIKG